jgi:2-amino-4-hydroxy-6-hydroxymethyldihydropteridine diphosphokinase
MILISVGANLPGRDGAAAIDTCIAASEAVKQIPGLVFTTASPWYRTTAIPKSDQPAYCNGMIRLEGEIGPEELLAKLQAIEVDYGRVRQIVNDPRTIDLDIIDLNGTIRATPSPILPHPRAHLRAFVLRPILDVAPGWRHPTFRRGVSSLLAELPPQGIEPWFDS